MLSFRLSLPLLLLILLAISAHADLYSPFNPIRQDRFACQISSHLNNYLTKNGQSYQDILSRIESDLQNEISTWASVLNYDQLLPGTSKILYSDYDYFLQNAFINIGNIIVNTLADKNYFGAYAFLSAKRETQYRLGEIKNYNLSTDKNLVDQISAQLNATRNLQWPSYVDDAGNLKRALYNCRWEWRYGDICSSADTSPPGDPAHPSYAKWIQVAQSANLILDPSEINPFSSIWNLG